MTRGRQGEYAPKPLAQWIEQQLAARGWAKQDLAVRLAERRGIRVDSAMSAVIRWTKNGRKINDRGLDDLHAIFGEQPPPQDGGPLQEQLTALQLRVAALEAGLSAAEHRRKSRGGRRDP